MRICKIPCLPPFSSDPSIISFKRMHMPFPTCSQEFSMRSSPHPTRSLLTPMHFSPLLMHSPPLPTNTSANSDNHSRHDNHFRHDNHSRYFSYARRYHLFLSISWIKDFIRTIISFSACLPAKAVLSSPPCSGNQAFQGHAPPRQVRQRTPQGLEPRRMRHQGPRLQRA